jgi:hypothetical protein
MDDSAHEQRQTRERMKFPAEVRIRASGMPGTIKTAQGALGVIDNNIPAELARLSRWCFARALLVEAIRTGKSRDMNAAVRQFRQALSNENWLA